VIELAQQLADGGLELLPSFKGRVEAGERFAAGDDNAVIAKALRVHVRSV